MDLTENLAEFALAPVAGEAALAMMRLSLLDWAACGIAGRDEPVARILRDMVLAEGGVGEASLIGGGRVPARAAALVNGAASHALDYDDTHFGHIGHPSVAVVPAALAMAQSCNARGEAFLQACLAGAELSIRVGLWLGRAHYQTGFHQTATAGAFGATAAAGRLLGLDAARMRQALGLASTRAAGLKSQFGTMGKPYHAGMAAATGVECARLASAGFVSRPDGLSCAQGFGPTHAGQADAHALDGLGTDWLFETVQHKFHACCHGTHAALEALAVLRPQVAPGAAAQITLTVHPRWLSVCDIARPATGLEAKFSYRLTAAMALAGWDTAALDTFTDAACADADLIALRDRVRVASDEAMAETAALVRITLTDGTRLEAAHDLEAPMSMTAREGKLRAKVRSLLGEAATGTLWKTLSASNAPNLKELEMHLAGV